MNLVYDRSDAEERIATRTGELLEAQRRSIFGRTDRFFAWLMLLQWLGGIAAAIWISPRTWNGVESETHVHVWAAILVGGVIASLPAYLAVARPASVATRHVVAVAQMLFSALLIHLCGGRIETHFHVFGSLALLAAYRDWRVLLTATLTITADHAFRGFFWPESVYGVLSASFMRSLEHGAWVVFEGVFLTVTIRQSLVEMRGMARQRAELESTNEVIEAEVQRRTEELRLAKNELKESFDALQERNQELDEFTYVASHDLQEPVRKLISFSKLLEQDLDDDLNPQAESDLHFIVDAAKRMQTLIQDLLTLSRAGRQALKSEPVDLQECADRAIDSLGLLVDESGAEIVVGKLPQVQGDETVLTQLYQNLIGNALKFTADRQSTIELTAEPDGNRWLLGVRDNGIGMKQDYAERVFQPFQRLHGRGEYEGNGIGLAICKKTVLRHGGRIWVEAEPGEGCHFKFTLQGASETDHCPADSCTALNESEHAVESVPVATIAEVAEGSQVDCVL